MEQDKTFLGTQPVGKLLLRLAIPTVIAQVVNMLYNIVDRIYIGHIPGEGFLALTGVGVCMPLILIVSAFAALISSGGAPKASIYMGQGDYPTAQRLMGNCFVVQLAISAVLTAVLLVFHQELLFAFGASENTIGYASDYMKIYAIGTVFVQLTLGMGAFITAQGFAKMGMVTVLTGAISNIILDPIFIFGCNMGVKGAAVATVCSQALSCLWVLWFLRSSKSTLTLTFNHFRFSPKLIFPALALGLASFIMQSSESIISVCFNTSLLEYGGDIAVGAMTVLTGVMQFAMLPMQGVAQGAQPILSYNYGANNKNRVKQTFWLLLGTCLTYSLLIWGAILIFPKAFAGIFTSDTVSLDFTAKALRIYCGVLGIFGIQVACQMTFVSLGNAPASIAVAVVRKFVLLIPLIYLLPHLVENPVNGVYFAEPVADLLAVTFTALLFTRQFKKAMKKMNA